MSVNEPAELKSIKKGGLCDLCQEVKECGEYDTRPHYYYVYICADCAKKVLKDLKALFTPGGKGSVVS